MRNIILLTGNPCGLFVLTAAAVALTGCQTAPVDPLLLNEGQPALMRQVMAEKDKIVHLTIADASGAKPVLLLLHGATEDPTEMMSIDREWRDKYDIYLYSYNFHRPIKKVAADFVGELRRLEAENSPARLVTVVVYSYSAIVFRESVILADDRALFSNFSLVQLVPTSGGSREARLMGIPGAAWLTGLVSPLSAAENPYGAFARKIWSGEGNRKFYEAIPAQRVRTLLIEGDSHSLARVNNRKVRQRYKNGLGANVTLIPESAGVTHECFPLTPGGLAYLRPVLETPGIGALSRTAPLANQRGPNPALALPVASAPGL